MTDLKITIDQLKNYLGTGLKVRVLDNSSWNVSNTSLSPIHLADNCEIQFIQCYRLSDLDKFIPELGFVPIEELGKRRSLDWSGEKNIKPIILLIRDMKLKRIPFDMMEKLFQWHFWPFGDEYFDQGLVIDKLTHGKEVDYV